MWRRRRRRIEVVVETVFGGLGVWRSYDLLLKKKLVDPYFYFERVLKRVGAQMEEVGKILQNSPLKIINS